MKNDDKQSSLMLAVIGIIPVIWFALLVAPYLSSGLMGILDGVSEAMNHPFSIRLCGDSVKTVLIFCCLTVWESGFIFLPGNITDEVKNMALLNGEM